MARGTGNKNKNMAYIVVFNIGFRDAFLATDTHYFVEEYMTYEQAEEDAKAALDGNQYRNYKIFEEANS